MDNVQIDIKTPWAGGDRLTIEGCKKEFYAGDLRIYLNGQELTCVQKVTVELTMDDRPQVNMIICPDVVEFCGETEVKLVKERLEE